MKPKNKHHKIGIALLLSVFVFTATSFSKTPIPRDLWENITGAQERDCPFTKCQDTAGTLCAIAGQPAGELCAGFTCPSYAIWQVGNLRVKGCPLYLPRERCEDYTSYFRTCLFNLSKYCTRPGSANSCGSRRYTFCKVDHAAFRCGPCVDLLRRAQCIEGCIGGGDIL